MKFSKTLPSLPVLLVLAGCPGQPPQLDKVSVTCTPTSVMAGQSAQCSASALDQDGAAFPVSSFTWSSGDETIAHVDASGSVSTPVVSGGDVAIRASATSSGKTIQGEATLSVTAKPPTVHSAPVSSSETWRASDNPHLVSAALSVDSGATLTLEPGLVLRFAPGAQLRVAQGRLLAPGTSQAPILLQAQNGARGSWSGLVFAAKDTASSLEHVTLSGCGGGQDAGACLVIRDGAAPVLKDVAVRDSASAGVLVTGEGSAFGADSARLSVSGSAGAAVRIDANQASTLPPGGNFSGNVPNAVELTGPRVSRTQTWPNLTIPYVVTEDLLVSSDITPITLTIAAGTQVRFAAGVKLTAGEGAVEDKLGALVLDGTAEAPLLFTAHSDNPQPGHWLGVHVRSDAPGRISHAIIEYAGEAPVPGESPANAQGNLNLYASTLGRPTIFTLTDLTVRKSSGVGIFVDGEFAPGSARLTSRDNATYPIAVSADAVRSLPAGLDFQNNGINMVALYGGELFSTQTWPNLGLPYRLSGTLLIGSKSNPMVTIAPGTEIRVAPDTAIVVGPEAGRPGALVAQPNKDNPNTTIRFVPDASTAPGGYWSGLHFWYATGSRLDHVLVTHAGGEGNPYFKHLLYGVSNLNIYKDGLGNFVTNSHFENAKNCAASRSSVVKTFLFNSSLNNQAANNRINDECVND